MARAGSKVNVGRRCVISSANCAMNDSLNLVQANEKSERPKKRRRTCKRLPDCLRLRLRPGSRPTDPPTAHQLQAAAAAADEVGPD